MVVCLTSALLVLKKDNITRLDNKRNPTERVNEVRMLLNRRMITSKDAVTIIKLITQAITKQL